MYHLSEDCASGIRDPLLQTRKSRWKGLRSVLPLGLIFIGLVSVYWIVKHRADSVYRVSNVDELVDLHLLKLESLIPSPYGGVFDLDSSLVLSLRKSEYLYTSIIGEGIELMLHMHQPDEGGKKQLYFGTAHFSSSFYRSDPGTIHKIKLGIGGVTADALDTAADCLLTRSCSLRILGSVKAKRLGMFVDYYDIDAILGEDQLWSRDEDHTATQGGIALVAYRIGEGDRMMFPALGRDYYHLICVTNGLKITLSGEFPHVFVVDVVYTPKDLKLGRVVIDASKISGPSFSRCSRGLGAFINDWDYAIIGPNELAYSELDIDDADEFCWSSDVELNNIALYFEPLTYRNKLATSDLHNSAGVLVNSNIDHPECPACPSGPPSHYLQDSTINDILRNKSYIAKMSIC